MVDEVEIKNVGGRNGVASEATLAALVSSLQGGTSTRERQLRLESLARASNTRGINESGKQQGILTKAVVGSVSAVGRLGKEFIAGGNRMGDFSQAIFGAESSITGLVRAVDGLIDNYRELTTVGASFNNSMFDFIKSSAETGLSMSEYGGFILQNSEKLRNLGGTVTEGAKRFGDISKILRNNFGSNLTRVGMTMSEMNDILIEYTDFSILRMGKETRSNAQLAKGAETYALELDKLSKLTGVSRKQLAEEQKKQLSDQRVRVAMDNMNDDQQQRMTSNLAFAGTYSQNFSEMLKDMIDSSPDSKDTQYLMTASSTFNRLSREVENMSTEEFAEFTAAVGQEVDAFSKLHPYMDQLPEFANIFALGPELAALSEMTVEERKKRLEEISKRDSLTAVLLNFELALNNVKTFILDQILALGPDLTALFGEIFDLSGTADAVSGTFDNLTTIAKELVTDGFSILGDEIREFTAYLKAGGDPTEYLMDGLRNVADSVYTWFKELFFGATREIETPAGKKTVETQGLFGKMASAFSEFWEGPTGTELKNTIAGYFKELIFLMEDTFVNSFLARTILGIDRKEVAARNLSEDELLSAGAAKNVGTLMSRMMYGQDAESYQDKQRLTQDDNLAQALGGPDSPLLKMLRESEEANRSIFYSIRSESVSLTSELARLGDLAASGEATPQDIELLQQTADALRKSGYFLSEADANSNATGTQGFENFGNQSYATLHGVEAVVPRNTNAGEYLARHFGNDWNASPAKGPVQQAAPNQESLVKHVNQLNNTMMMVLSEMRKNNELEKKTMNSVKGLSGDLYRGI